MARDDVEENSLVRPPTGRVEAAFADMEVPSWKEQLTGRAIVTGLLLSVLFNIVVCKLNLTTGIVPSMNVPAGLLGFAVIKFYTTTLERARILHRPFTRQENTVVQTCIVASSGIAFSSGTASYLLGMSSKIAEHAEEGNTPNNVKSLSLGWMTGFLFAVSFIGLFSIVALRKFMIIKFKLTYPSGTAAGFLINGFHTPAGSRLAMKQVKSLLWSSCGSFSFACFQWFFTGGGGCGFSNFPTFGLHAFAQRFYFDFSATYIGVGMICPYMVNVSLMIGAVLSWGIMWPLIATKRGDWFAANLSSGSLRGIQGYRVFISIAMMLGDGLFHLLYLLTKTIYSFYWKVCSGSPSDSSDSESDSNGDDRNNIELDKVDERKREEYFVKDQIPNSMAALGYAFLGLVSTVVVPLIFPQLKWLHVVAVYIAAPVLAFCNAYGCGLTDWSLASNYGKIAIIVFAALVGGEGGGIVAGLAACGVAMSIVSTASDLMQDFKTGYLTLSSPRAMFVAQAIGTAIGCIVSPAVFWFFYKAYELGDPNGAYPAPYASLYRGIALLGTKGHSALPKHCLALAAGFFVLSVLLNAVREGLCIYETRYRLHRFVPSPMCMAIPFYLGANFSIDMCLGSMMMYAWKTVDSQSAKDHAPGVAAGLICGESIWGIPAAMLSMGGVKAPICMKFLSASVNNNVDQFLNT